MQELVEIIEVKLVEEWFRDRREGKKMVEIDNGPEV